MKAHRWIVPSAGVLLACLQPPAARADVLFFPPPSTALGPCTPLLATGGYTYCTVSTSHETHTDRADLPDSDSFSTRVLGTAIVTGPGIHQGATAFDQTTPNPFGSAAVDSLFTQARAAARATAIALAAGRPFVAITESGPAQTASGSARTTALVSHTLELPFGPLPSPGCLYDVCMVVPPDTSSYVISNTHNIGPGTYPTGVDLGVLLFLPAGTDSLNTNFFFTSDYLDTYQTTTLHSATYEITDTLLLQLIGTIHPAVQSAALGSGSDFLHRLGEESDLGGADDDPPSHRAWAQGYGSWSHDRAQGMVPGNNASTGGVAGGIGFALAPGLSFGFGADHGWTTIDESAVFEHADLDLTQIGLNAAYASNDWLVTAAFTGGTGSVDTSHGTAALGGVSSASYDVRILGVSTEAGYRVLADGWSLTPKLGLDWTSVHTGAIAETGGLALGASDHTATRSRVWFGVAAAIPGIDLDGHTLDLSAEARIIDVFCGRGVSLPVDFGGSALRIDGLTQDQYAGDIAATASLRLTAQAAFFFSGELLYTGHADTTAAAHAGIRYSF